MSAHVYRLLVVIISAFVFNLVWENLHSYLYVHYKGGRITESVLMHAAFFDACVTGVGALLFLYVWPFRGRILIVMACFLLFAIGLEIFALKTQRWEYASSMPIIPIVRVGLTPSVQLALIGYASFVIAGLL